MGRIRRALVIVAVLGWLGAIGSQLAALRTSDAAAAASWKVRRNQFLLLSSLSMNTAVLSTVYLVAKRAKAGIDAVREGASGRSRDAPAQ